MLTYSFSTPISRIPRQLCRLVLFLGAVAVLLCGCSGPRANMTPIKEALRDTRVMRLEIIQVYNNDKMDYTTEFHVSHVIDATVLDGPDALIGKAIVLPYDIFNVAKPPPVVGDVIVTAPADWVKRNEGGKARGFGQ